MYTTIQNNKNPTQVLNGRYYQTFRPKTPQELIKIHHMGCIGNTELKNIQIEKGNTPTGFVEPKITQMETSGILNDLRSLNLMLTDVNSDLWGRIKANNKGMLTEFFDSNIKSAIATSANTIMQQINSTLNGDYSSFNQRLDALRSTVKNEAVSSTITQLADTYDRKIATANENVVSRVNQSINSVTTSVQELERGVVKRSDIAVTANGLSFGSSKVIDGQTLSSILNVTPNMMTAITKQMRVTGDMLVNGAITSDKIQANSITAGHLASGSISASKLDVDDAFLNNLVAKDSFFEKMKAKEAFVSTIQSIDIKATQLSAEFLSAYKGHIGGFQIGQISFINAFGDREYYTGKFITGKNEFSVGMSNGDGTSPGRVALWVNWGKNWNEIPENGWYINHDGHMYAKGGTDFQGQVDFKERSTANFYGTAYFGNGAKFSGATTFDDKITVNRQAEFPQGLLASGRIGATGGIYTGHEDVYGEGSHPNPDVGTNAVVWWNQIGSGSVKYWLSQPSDSRLKKNIKKTSVKGLKVLKQLDLVTFDWRESNKNESIGLIAQSVEKIIPQAVLTEEKRDFKHIDYKSFVPYLIKAVQELSTKVEQLERKLNNE